jgi:DNA-binding LacI/PurR family transcriptional regulator
MTAGQDRLNGFLAAMTAAGLHTDAVVHGDFTFDGGERGATDLFDRHPDLDGVFVANDLMASGALPVITGLGRRVPDDVAVVGFDDSVVATTTRPRLTTVRQPVVEMANRMAQIVLAKIAGESHIEPELFDTELVIRDSA